MERAKIQLPQHLGTRKEMLPEVFTDLLLQASVEALRAATLADVSADEAIPLWKGVLRRELTECGTPKWFGLPGLHHKSGNKM